MHLLAAQPGQVQPDGEAIDLAQDPAEIIVLSAADTELAVLASAAQGFPHSVRLANYLSLTHNLSVDLYLDQTACKARVIVARLLGGRSYWRYGVDELTALAARADIRLVLLPGDDKPDPELRERSTVDDETYERLWAYLRFGGPANATGFLKTLADLPADTPTELPKVGLHNPVGPSGAPTVPIIFYTAHLIAGNTAPIDALATALATRGLAAQPIFLSSLKDPDCVAFLDTHFAEHRPRIILNSCGFAVGSLAADPLEERARTVLDSPDVPVLQVILSSSTASAWADNPQGLSARDLAMHIALPEVDGRVATRAISVKSDGERDKNTQCILTRYEPLADRIDYVADLAKNWIALQQAERPKLAFILANYPTKRARLGNGVGLDTPASLDVLMTALGGPKNCFEQLRAGVLNDCETLDLPGASLALGDYKRAFSALPQSVQTRITDRWGLPEDDAFLTNGAFKLAIHTFGNIAVTLQPARGYGLDPEESYHDPDLPPPHRYLAHYIYLRQQFGAQALINLGKHGNLEWLPGKALALSQDCLPDAIMGPVPNFYPFIVNDPGEGSQAKRRTHSVIVDHLTPPLTRAELHGELAELERLVEEIYQASQFDARRLPSLRQEIAAQLRACNLDKDLGIKADASDQSLAQLDTYLCELKELQIRDGLHVFGVSPTGRQRRDLALALTRLARGDGAGENASFLNALAQDLALDFNPLDPGDKRVEALELQAQRIVEGVEPAPGPAAAAVFGWIESDLLPMLDSIGNREVAALMSALKGRFTPPGPSGAPSRGRLDVLPTGRNFYSVDSRALPTPTAWKLGWASANQVIDTYVQEQGEPLTAIALSAWGTANMRTGGDDIAQALALMGVKPTWDKASGRVTGIEVIDPMVLDRPRVDVTFRVSGFFRDAFPAQIELIDKAARTLAALDEPPEVNPIADRVRRESLTLEAKGITPDAALKLAGARVFGSKPGSYGAGLQTRIDEGNWSKREELADTYLEWSGYAYGAGAQGVEARTALEARLNNVQAVLHNQDNREHDLLDSDDYYQFEGGLAAAVWAQQDRERPVYHNDHSRPERPVTRRLEDEIGRIVRGRVTNPKWIAGVMRHGYKGAFEMAATVDYLFGFAASANAVADHHFDAVAAAYLEDPEVLAFLDAVNIDARKDIAARLNEAIERGLWTPRRNALHELLKQLDRGRL